MKRLITGILAASAAAIVVLRLSPLPFGIVVTAVVLWAAAEFSKLAWRVAHSNTLQWALGLGLAAIGFTNLVYRGTIPLSLPSGLAGEDGWFAAAAAVLALTALVGLTGRAEPRERLEGATLCAFGTLWLGLFLVAAIDLHGDQPVLLFWVLAVASLGDVGAYYGGKLFGRRRLAPLISPKKTIAGSISGLFASLITGIVVFVVWRGVPALGLDVPLLAVLCGGVAQAGDLVESMLKRAAEVKDTGRLLPGHGGILDRLDSVLLATPLLLLAVQLGAMPSAAP